MAEKTAGQWVGTIVGAVVGFYTGGAGWAATAGSMATGASVGAAVGGMLDPPKGPNMMGPRLDDLSFQSSTYGAPIPRVYGTVAQFGNVFWLENNLLKEVVTTESQGGKGGGGSELTSFKYLATFAVGLCKGDIAGIRRLWVGPNLIYDAGSSDISTIIASNQASALFTLYTGTETQLPDDRMQAALGVANTPAYRGLAYIVFKDFPLEDYGKSLLGAQVKAEIVSSGATTPFSLISEYVSPPSYQPGWSYSYSPVFISDELVRFYMPGWDNWYPAMSTYSIYDFRLGRHSVLPGIVIATPNNPVPPSMDSDNENTFWIDAKTYFPGMPSSASGGNIVERGQLIANFTADKIGILKKFSEPLIIGVPVLERVGTTDGSNIYTVSGSPTAIVRKYDDKLNEISSLSLGSFALKMGTTRLDVYDGYVWIFENPEVSGCRVFKVDINLLAFQYIGNLPDIYATGIYYNVQVRVINGMVIRAWPDDVNKTHVIQYIKVGGLSSDSTPLSSVVSDECLLSSLLTTSDLDVTELTQSVRGYRVSNTAAIRAAIEPLQGIFPFDVIQSGYKIKFKPRGGASVATIQASELDARESTKAAGSALIISREMDSIIPCRVVLKHMDVEREYDQGEQYAERLNTSAVNVQTVETSVVMTAAEAAGVAEVLLYLYWLERYDITLSIPPTYSQLEPGDVVTVVTADASYSLRLTPINYTTDGRLECAAKYNSAALYSPAALGVSGQSTGNLLMPIGSAAYELLDIPLLLDATDTPGFPAAMTGYLNGWSGGALFRTDDAGQTWTNLQSFTAPGTVIGSATVAIGSGQTALMDTTSLLSVNLISGDLSSVTEAQLLGGANHFAYGVDGRWEIVAAQNCVLQGDGSYILSKLLRGRFGSEWSCGLHQVGDSLVLLDSNRLKFITTNLNAIGLSRTYRGVTAGKALSSDSDKAFTYQGVNLECLAPVYLNGNRHPTTNDWSLTWIRRARVGGEWRDYVDATLGEASESYEIDIYSSAAYTTLKRTISGLTTPSAAYTSAQQVTDFGSNQATLYVKVYQLSANVGRGYPLTTSITR